MNELMDTHTVPLNILLSNYRYFVSGGPERYMFNAKALFEEKGHNVIPFSVKHAKNRPTEFSDFFLSSLSDNENAVYFRQLKLNPKTLLKLLDRSFYSIEARKKLKALMRNRDIDVAYILHFLRWISPSIFAELSHRSIPIIVRISDFEYMCTGAHLLRDGKICELCVGNKLWPSVKYRCVQGSTTLSIIQYLAMSLYRKIGILDKIDAFICPSQFTLEKMVEAGYDEKKLFHVPTLVDSEKVSPSFKSGNYILYFGRISYEKGINVLLDAFVKYDRASGSDSLPLYIILTRGIEAPEVIARVKSENMRGVKVLGGLSPSDFYSYVQNSAFTVVPSLFYENLPNVILESYAYGKPVIGSRRGSVLEVIRDGETGLLFEAGNTDDLAEKIRWMADHPQECMNMGRKARKLAEDVYNKELHYKRLIDVFQRFL